jgi:uncharacterized protein DUF6519
MKGDFTRFTFDPKKHYSAVLMQQGRVALDADWNEQDAIVNHRVETETLDVVGPSGAPAGNAGFSLTTTSGGSNFNISAGRAYVDGILCENEQSMLITAQPDLPGFKLPTAAGNYIAYLEVWLRHITALNDEAIRESALGGPDTCTRAKTVWQVGLLPVKQNGIDCSTTVPEWTNLIAPGSGTLAARAQPDSATQGPCTLPAKAGFRRLENQLYRVEIHTSTSSQTTFKWSRDNGSVVAAWLAPQSGQAANTIRVSSAGPDSVLGFAAGQWVELTDDVRELNFQPGTLVQLTGVSGNILTYDSDPSHAIPAGPITYPQSPDPNTWPDIHPRVRRWDSAAVQTVQAAQWLDLEDGVQVNFAAGTFLPGDYWLIPARTLKGDVEWPVDGSSNPLQQLPRGVRRHFCRLAVVQLTGTTWSVTAPCLPTFPPLTGVGTGADKGIHVVDVRTAIPDASLPNDSVLALNPAQLRQEFTLRVLCDSPVDPVSAQPTTCFLSMEMPYPFDVGNFTPQLILGTQSVVLPASVKAVAGSGGSGEILLTVSGTALNFIPFLLGSMAKLNLGSTVLMRLTLKGNFIWSQNDPTMFLDGDSFGIKRTDPDGSTHIGLRLPKSGDGRKGGNFEMWFWVALPATVTGLAFAKEAVNSGEATTMTVTLSSPAPAGGVEIAITDDNPNVLVLPSPVTVPEKQTSVSVPVTRTQLPPGMGTVTVTATATLAGASASGKLTINAVLLITRLDVPPSVVSGTPTKGTVTINAPGGPNGATVALKSSHQNVQVPATVLVPPNATTAEFAITTVAVPPTAPPVSATITATLGTSSVPANITLTPRVG